MLPSNLMLNKETLEECANATLKDKVGLTNIYKETCDVFTEVDRIPDTRIVGISVLCIMDTVKVNKDISSNMVEQIKDFVDITYE